MDLLDGSRPKRLVRYSGSWHLEVVRLVAVNHAVYEPITQRLKGPNAILSYLQQAAPSLGEGARELMRVTGAGDEAFEAVDGQWVPAGMSPTFIRDLARQHTQTKQVGSTELLDVKRDFAMLRASYDGLRVRVAEMEARLLQFENLAKKGHFVQDATRLSESQLPGARPGHPGSVLPSTQGRGPAADAAPPIVAAAPAVAPTVAVQEEGPPAVEIPHPDELAKCVSGAIGVDYTMKPNTKKKHRLKGPLQGMFGSLLIGDQGQELGMIIADTRSTVYLGGTLLLLPEGTLSDQVRQNEPSDMVVEATSELWNMVCSTFNAIDGNPHVKANPCKSMVEGGPDWLAHPRAREDNEDSFGGIVIVVSK